MTALDILVLALPADRARAEQVLDGLHQAKIASLDATRIETPDLLSPDWVRVAQLARASRCVLCCWSDATAAPDAAALRALGAELVARGTALSIEFDRGARPAEMAGSTTYPAYGWRSRPGAVLRFLFGDIHRMQIAVAAQRKVSGQDPPPPAAFWQLLRGRGWVALVGLFAVLGSFSGLWQLWNDTAIARLLDPKTAAEFTAARDAHDCERVHAFSNRHPGSPWADEVTEFLGNCQIRDVPVARPSTQTLPVYGRTKSEAELDARNHCRNFVANAAGTLLDVRLIAFEPGGVATAECRFEHRLAVPTEVYVPAR